MVEALAANFAEVEKFKRERERDKRGEIVIKTIVIKCVVRIFLANYYIVLYSYSFVNSLAFDNLASLKIIFYV